MKQFLVLILFIFSAIQSQAQVETRYYTRNDTVRSSFKYTRKNAVVKTMPSFDLGVYVIKAQAGEHFVTQKVAIK